MAVQRTTPVAVRLAFLGGLVVGCLLGVVAGYLVGLGASQDRAERQVNQAMDHAIRVEMRLEEARLALNVARRENLDYWELARKYHWRDQEIRSQYDPADWALLERLTAEPASPAPPPPGH